MSQVKNVAIKNGCKLKAQLFLIANIFVLTTHVKTRYIDTNKK